MKKNQKMDLQVDSLIRLTEKAKLEDDPIVKRTIMSAVLSGDPKLLESIGLGLHYKAAYEMLQRNPYKPPVNHPKPSLELLQGRYLLLGIIEGGKQPYFLLLDLLNQHLVVFGGSGSGKTNLLYGIGLQCMRKNIPVWFFDRDKQDYRHLKRFEPDLLILDVAEHLPKNFLEPPTGVNHRHWSPVFVQVFCKSGSLLDGSESLLLKVIRELKEDFGIYRGKTTHPSLSDLYDKVRSLVFKRSEHRFISFQSSILNRLEAIIALQEDMVDIRKGVPIEEMAKRSIVFEVKGLTERVARFVLNMQLYSLFMHRIAVGERGNTLRTLSIIDEAKWLAPPGYNEKISFSPLTYVLSQAREIGMGMVIADQSAELDEAVYVNSHTKMCFRLGSGKDIQKIKQTFSLTQDQADFINRLGQGECIVRVPSEDPFLLKTMRVNFE